MYSSAVTFVSTAILNGSRKNAGQRTNIVLLGNEGLFGLGEYGIQVIFAGEFEGMPLLLCYCRLLLNLVSLLVTDIRDLSLWPNWTAVLVLAIIFGKLPACVAEDRSCLGINCLYMPDGVPVLEQDARISIAAELNDFLQCYVFPYTVCQSHRWLFATGSWCWAEGLAFVLLLDLQIKTQLGSSQNADILLFASAGPSSTSQRVI